MIKKLLLPGGILLFGIAAIVVLVVAKPKPQAGPTPSEPAHVKVAVTRALPQTVRLSVNAHGTVAPKREIDLVAQVSGQIVEVEPAFVEGGFFAASEVLIQIDERDYRAALLNAQARLAEAQRQVAEEEGRSLQARREWRDLGDQNANNLFLRKPQLAAARAQLASAQGEVDMAGLNLERTRIRVPFDGRVKQIHADLGQFVSAGTRVATVYDSTVVEVRIPLTEKQAALIDLPLARVSDSQSRSASVAAVSMNTTSMNPTSMDPASMDSGYPLVKITGSVAGRRHQWQGLLTRTDAFIDSESRMYYAVIEVADPFAEVPLLPGLFVEAEIAGREIEDVTVLPREALYQMDQILALDAENKIVNHTVDVLQKSDSHVWVRADFSGTGLISVEKQSLTPAGTIVDPKIITADGGSEVATTAEPGKE